MFIYWSEFLDNTMTDNSQYYFYNPGNYMISSSSAMDISELVFEISFDKFALDGFLQTKFNLESVKYLKKFEHKGEKWIKESTADYLSNLIPHKTEEKREYLLNNGDLRILVLNEDLKMEIKNAGYFDNSNQ